MVDHIIYYSFLIVSLPSKFEQSRLIQVSREVYLASQKHVQLVTFCSETERNLVFVSVCVYRLTPWCCLAVKSAQPSVSRPSVADGSHTLFSQAATRHTAAVTCKADDRSCALSIHVQPTTIARTLVSTSMVDYRLSHHRDRYHRTLSIARLIVVWMHVSAAVVDHGKS